MPGKACPKCRKPNLYVDKIDARKSVCSACGCTTYESSANNGKGNKCPICKKFTLKNDRCESCGTKVSGGNKK